MRVALFAIPFLRNAAERVQVRSARRVSASGSPHSSAAPDLAVTLRAPDVCAGAGCYPIWMATTQTTSAEHRAVTLSQAFRAGRTMHRADHDEQEHRPRRDPRALPHVVLEMRDLRARRSRPPSAMGIPQQRAAEEDARPRRMRKGEGVREMCFRFAEYVRLLRRPRARFSAAIAFRRASNWGLFIGPASNPHSMSARDYVAPDQHRRDDPAEVVHSYPTDERRLEYIHNPEKHHAPSVTRTRLRRYSPSVHSSANTVLRSGKDPSQTQNARQRQRHRRPSPRQRREARAATASRSSRCACEAP